MLVLENIKFQYDEKTAFDIPDLKLSKGEELLILGKSGGGKTTILNIIGGLLKPITGNVQIDNISLYQLSGNKLDKFRGKNIGIVFQKPHILQPLTVLENLQLAQYFSGKSFPLFIDQTLKDLGIFHKKNSKVNTLSEGEAQRVSIARALINQPKVILADEPTSSLDDDNADAVIKILQDQASKLQAVLIIVTHDQRVKNHIANRITVGGTI